MDQYSFGSWAVLPKSHPLVPGLVRLCELPNPAYETAMMLGKRPVIRVRDKETNTVTETPISKFIYMHEEVGNYVRFPRMMVPRTNAIDETSWGEAFDFKSLITPREYQHAFIDKLLSAVSSDGGAVGKAPPGFGKTIGVLEVIARLGRTAIILVNKEFLMEQWVERILGTEQMMERMKVKTRPSEIYPPSLGIKPEDVGIVRGPKCEWEGKGIVVAMAQTLVRRSYSEEFYKYFGTLVVDEVHNFAAPTFQSTIVMFPARNRLGVTATVERKDGLQAIFHSHIGEIAVVGEVPRIAPRINRVVSPVVWTVAVEKAISRFERVDFNRLLDFLCTHEARNRFITGLMLRAAEKGRKILVLSQRREHLVDLKAMFETACQKEGLAVSTDFYVGGMKGNERSMSARMQVLFATYGMAKEALDIPSLDTLFMVTPVADVEQPVGRIQRLYKDKLAPVVVDIVDEALKSCIRLADKRTAEYRRLGWLPKLAA